MSRAEAADYLLAMSVIDRSSATSALGLFGTRLARRGIHARHMFGTGFALNLAALAVIVLRVPGELLWWSLYGLGAAVERARVHGAQRRLPARRSPAAPTRRSTSMMFGGSFAVQWGIGVIVDARARAYGLDTSRRACALRSRSCSCVYAPSRSCGSSRGWKRHTATAVGRRRPDAMHLHILGICGTFMGGIAAIAQRGAATRHRLRRQRLSADEHAARGARHRAAPRATTPAQLDASRATPTSS